MISTLVLAVIVACVAVMLTGDPRAFHLPLLEVKSTEEWKVSGNVKLPEIVRLPEHQRRKILMPVAFNDFDPTEVAVPWYVLTQAGHTVVFATPNGSEKPSADPLVLEGYLMGLIRAEPLAREIYDMLCTDQAFLHPIKYADIVPSDYDGMIFPGGHGPLSKEYLESLVLREKAKQFWSLKRTTGAVCHGVLVLSRAGLLKGVRTTAVTRDMERAAYHLTRAQYGDYHLSTTWPIYTQDEIEASGAKFEAGPWNPIHTLWLGHAADHRRSHVVEDGHYVSARFPGDVWTWALRFGYKVAQEEKKSSSS
jgi:putative intracellular protease/amidase